MSEEQPRLTSGTLERYFEETQFGYDSDDGMTPADQAEETEDEFSFVRRLEEEVVACDLDMDKSFTREEWQELSPLLKTQIRAYRFAKEHQRRRALDAAPPSRTFALLERPGADIGSLPDQNVTRRIRASDKVEVNTDEPDVGTVRHLVGGGTAETKVDLEEAESKESSSTEDKPADFEDLMDVVVSREEFKKSIEAITNKLSEIPKEFEKFQREIVDQVGIALQTAIRGDLTPSPVLSVDNKLPFGDSGANTPVTKNKMPKGLNTPVPTGYALQAPMGTVMSQKALKKLPSPVQPTVGPVVNRQLSYGASVPAGAAATSSSLAVSVPASADPTIVKLIPMKDASTLGIRLRGLELGAVIEFLRDYRMKRRLEEHQVFKITKFLTTSQLNQVHQYAKQEDLFSGKLDEFIALSEEAHMSVLYHMIRAKSMEEYRVALKYAKFPWIEGTDIDHTVIGDFLTRANEYTVTFLEIMEILDTHTEQQFIPPMHARNRSMKITLLGCYLDGFPNREGDGKHNTVGWRVYDAANQTLQKKPQDVWTDIGQLSECLLMEFREFWKSSQHQMEHMRVLNTRKVLERKLPVSSSTKDIVVYEKKPASGSAAARPAFKPNQRRFLDRSGKVYVLGSTTPLVRSEEESEDIPRFEELEDEVTSVQNEEELDDLDNQQVPKEGIDDESDPAYLDFFGQLEGKAAGKDAYGGCYTQFYSQDGKCIKGKDCKWDHSEKGMRHCLKQTIARCRSSKYFPNMEEFMRMCKEPGAMGNSKPDVHVAGTSKPYRPVGNPKPDVHVAGTSLNRS